MAYTNKKPRIEQKTLSSFFSKKTPTKPLENVSKGTEAAIQDSGDVVIVPNDPIPADKVADTGDRPSTK